MDLDKSFRGRVVDEDLQLVSLGPPIRTIWIAVWSPPPRRSPADVLDEILHDVHPSPQLRFREDGTDTDELRYASWYAGTDEDASSGASTRTPFGRAPMFKRPCSPTSPPTLTGH